MAKFTIGQKVKIIEAATGAQELTKDLVGQVGVVRNVWKPRPGGLAYSVWFPPDKENWWSYSENQLRKAE